MALASCIFNPLTHRLQAISSVLGLAVKRGSLYDIAAALEFVLRKTLSAPMPGTMSSAKPPALRVASYVREVAEAIVEQVRHQHVYMHKIACVP